MYDLMEKRLASMVESPCAKQLWAMKPSFSSARQIASSPSFQFQLGMFNRWAFNQETHTTGNVLIHHHHDSSERSNKTLFRVIRAQHLLVLDHVTVAYGLLFIPSPVSVLCEHDLSYLIVILQHLCDDADLWMVVFNRYHSVGRKKKKTRKIFHCWKQKKPKNHSLEVQKRVVPHDVGRVLSVGVCAVFIG